MLLKSRPAVKRAKLRWSIPFPELPSLGPAFAWRRIPSIDPVVVDHARGTGAADADISDVHARGGEGGTLPGRPDHSFRHLAKRGKREKLLCVV